MSTGENNPFLISAPPPSPVVPVVEADSEPAETDTGNFITLPPGITDSGTHRVPVARPERADRPLRDQVSFFPAVPGIVPPEVVAAVAPATAPAEVILHAPAIEETTFATPRHAAPTWRLVLPDGERVPLADRVILGRNPSASAEWPDAELLPLSDLTKSVSKTHAMLEVDEGTLWVHDLASTNGVFVVQADDVTDVLDTRVAVPEGSDLELGQYVMRVERN